MREMLIHTGTKGEVLPGEDPILLSFQLAKGKGLEKFTNTAADVIHGGQGPSVGSAPWWCHPRASET